MHPIIGENLYTFNVCGFSYLLIVDACVHANILVFDLLQIHVQYFET